MRGARLVVAVAMAASPAAVQVQFDAPRFFETGRKPIAVVATDVDEDGHLDLVTADFGSSRLSIFRSDGNGNVSLFGFVGGLPRPDGLVAFDVNGDGHVDLATTSTSTVFCVLGDGTGAFTPGASATLVGDAVSLLGGDVACSPRRAARTRGLRCTPGLAFQRRARFAHSPRASAR